MLLSTDLLVDLENFAEELADAAGATILPYFRTQISVEDKGGFSFDPVTAADKAAERVMRELIAARYPDHGILGEEEPPIASKCGRTWVLDPVNGTQGFIADLPLWGTLIDLNDGSRPVIGVADHAFTGERFPGIPNGAWRNGHPLKRWYGSNLDTAIVMCTAPHRCHEPEQRTAFYAITASARLVRDGGDCYAYCMLAAGHVDALIEAGLQTYDVQALIPIIEGAGGVIITWDGSDAQEGGAWWHAEILCCVLN